ncbi:hypothetical protein ALO_07793 [Acetonema longum DSM 6540]|uniref:Uncharacterized protein n=1 Tax=Acetonema longum DSM 6540 TaxID=1009370 RepID=F7NHL1_9FIRM|nr:hypothetical protein ALO_07793 [Acetonema longum DSM 6540]
MSRSVHVRPPVVLQQIYSICGSGGSGSKDLWENVCRSLIPAMLNL